MGKLVYLDVADKKVLATNITYNDLIVLYNQFIEMHGKTPMLTECLSKNNLPQANIVKKVIENNGLTYNEFLLQFGEVRLLSVGNTKKCVNDITYEDLIILYRQYIEKNNKVPTSTTSNFKNNLPHRTRIIEILQEKGITHNDFLQSLGYRSNKKRYDDLHINDIVGRWKIIGVGKSRESGKNKNIPYWICQCTCGSEIIREVSDNALKRRESLSCGCIQQESISKLKGTFRKQSFYDWCKSNNHEDFLDRWDYSLNKVNPQNISYCSKEKNIF